MERGRALNAACSAAAFCAAVAGPGRAPANGLGIGVDGGLGAGAGFDGGLGAGAGFDGVLGAMIFTLTFPSP